MTTHKTSARYPLPETLEPVLGRLHEYWDSIQRGFRIMPYWDDMDMTKLADIRDDVVVLDVLDSPARFRFALVGKNIAAAYHGDLEGLFVDETELRAPLEEFLAQCRATADEPAATHVRLGGGTAGERSYCRLLMPMWGNGRVEMLLGAIRHETGGDAA